VNVSAVESKEKLTAPPAEAAVFSVAVRGKLPVELVPNNSDAAANFAKRNGRRPDPQLGPDSPAPLGAASCA
jgi:hypothetical protein